MNRLLSILTLLILPAFCFGQVDSVEELEAWYLNWFNEDYPSGNILGVSVDKTYGELIQQKEAKKTIIVAVIDGGVDVSHEDLDGRIWVNADEIPGNGIDDDNNGYIDDVHGWNFIGNENGENVHYENLEYTRIVRQNDKSDPNYLKAKSLYDKELSNRKEEKLGINRFEDVYLGAKATIRNATGIEVNSPEDLDRVRSGDSRVLSAKKFLKERYNDGLTDELLEQLIEANEEYLEYFLNLDFDARSLVGDDPFDLEDRQYGNPDVKGPRSSHGTAVAGVIAAIRDNGIGIDGIATHVKIMVLRSTPQGDERDKDVALAIRYAVDNGADVVNMSFGKELSPQKQFIDEAVRYAEEKGVLLIHASGNSGENVDVVESYPSDRYLDGSEPANWLNVGASDMALDPKVAAIFSNYGKSHVDLFAPGVNIISLDSSNTYSTHDGTSLAAPVVSGVAALILSYYPDLTPEEVIDILLESSFTFRKPKKVLVPSLTGEKRSKTKFKELSKCGGIVNAYEAWREAEKRYD